MYSQHRRTHGDYSMKSQICFIFKKIKHSTLYLATVSNGPSCIYEFPFTSQTRTHFTSLSAGQACSSSFVRRAAIINTVQPFAAAQIQRHRSTQRFIPKCKYYNAYKKVSHFSFTYLSNTDFYTPEVLRRILQLCTEWYYMNNITESLLTS